MKFFKIKTVILICVSLLLMSTQCEDDNIDRLYFDCDVDVITDNSVFENSTSDFYNTINAEIIDNCLLIRVTSSGCSGGSWTMELVASEAIAESSPPQRSLKFILTNNEACLAVITKEQSFDLTTLQVEGFNEIILNIDDFPEPLSYSY